MKRLIIPSLALALLLAWPLTQVQAQPEAQDFQKLASLHDQLWAKQMEVEALVQAGNTKELKAATDEAIKLRAQIREERSRMGGPEWGPGQGWGAGGRGGGGCPYYHGGHGWGKKGGRGWHR